MNSAWIVILALIGTANAIDNTIGVQGQLMCGYKTSKGNTVKLVNRKDLGLIDEELGTAESDESGAYTVKADPSTLQKLSSINAYLKIYTDCNKAELDPCKREITLGLPDSYVKRTDNTDALMRGGSLQLQSAFQEDGHECL